MHPFTSRWFFTRLQQEWNKSNATKAFNHLISIWLWCNDSTLNSIKTRPHGENTVGTQSIWFGQSIWWKDIAWHVIWVTCRERGEWNSCYITITRFIYWKTFIFIFTDIEIGLFFSCNSYRQSYHTPSPMKFKQQLCFVYVSITVVYMSILLILLSLLCLFLWSLNLIIKNKFN